ncbi:hypothetical protein [Mycoplasmopsis cynos]|nr:hypothetical protein [Mycoplasmopsis cynos]
MQNHDLNVKLFSNFVFLILFKTNSVSLFNDISYVTNFVYDQL